MSVRYEQELKGTFHHKVGDWRVFVDDITIQRVSDGLETVIDGSVPWPAKEPGDRSAPIYMFAHGNYSCDCNRHLFFTRALGLADNYDDVECSHGKYVVTGPQWLVDAIEDERGNR